MESNAEENVDENIHSCEAILTMLSFLLMLLTLPISLFFCIKVVKEYERIVIFRLGRLLREGSKGPGVVIVLPCIDTYKRVDLRTTCHENPTQEILSKDAIPVSVNTVVFYRVSNPVAAVCNVSNFEQSTKSLAASSIQKSFGEKSLMEINSGHDNVRDSLKPITDIWGAKLERV
ncbi:Band 7 protein [Armadillidium nasatum]|uniref:Band 7 protein n=1 Tax=Armadillidium nasatum TaxID=96803 RepID=A0A5N5TAF1_9CRUS|nr:Band 7 protein [Armadillidium nasatum]